MEIENISFDEIIDVIIERGYILFWEENGFIREKKSRCRGWLSKLRRAND